MVTRPRRRRCSNSRSSSQPGCLGAESVRGDNGLGITVAYFTDESAIRAWKQNSEHLVAQRLGKERWYSHYELRVAKVERAYSGPELSRPTRQSAKGSARNPVVASDRASISKSIA